MNTKSKILIMDDDPSTIDSTVKLHGMWEIRIPIDRSIKEEIAEENLPASVYVG